MTYIEAYICKKRMMSQITIESAILIPRVIEGMMELADLSIELALANERYASQQ